MVTFTNDSRSIKLTLSYLYLLYNHLYSSDVKGLLAIFNPLLAIFNPHVLERCKAVITRLYKFSVKVCKSTFQIFILARDHFWYCSKNCKNDSKTFKARQNLMTNSYDYAIVGITLYTDSVFIFTGLCGLAFYIMLSMDMTGCWEKATMVESVIMPH